MDNLKQLEAIAEMLMEIFEVVLPPVPIELMLRYPRDGMWSEVDPAQLSFGFMSVKARYAPRMSTTRLLARHIMQSLWGEQHNLSALVDSSDSFDAFVRMLIMPSSMLDGLSVSEMNPSTISLRFEVPEEDALLRLQDLI